MKDASSDATQSGGKRSGVGRFDDFHTRPKQEEIMKKLLIAVGIVVAVASAAAAVIIFLQRRNAN